MVVTKFTSVNVPQVSFINKCNKWFVVQESWCAALSDKCRYERRSMKDTDVVSRRVRRKIPTKATSPVMGIGIVHHQGIKREWKHPEGENSESIIAHKQWLFAEHQKVKQDIAKVKLLMELTFTDRRIMVQQNIRIQEMMENYPCLFTEKMVSRYVCVYAI